MTNDHPIHRMPPMLAWARLMRISAAPTAATNILAGFVIANGCWQPTKALILLIASSCCLYVSGMVLNDVCDYEVDCVERPERPLPSGAIPRTAALICYACLSLTGLALSLLVGTKSAAVATAIVVAVFLYSKILKLTPAAPITMGICRFLNIMLGASVFVSGSETEFLGWPVLAWWMAAALGVLITGLTRFAQNEVQVKSKFHLTSSTAIIVTGITAFFAAAIFSCVNGTHSMGISVRYILLVALISVPGLSKVIVATVKQDPGIVRKAVGSIIRSLIFYDAAICFLVVPENVFYACATLVFFIPIFILKRLVSTT